MAQELTEELKILVTAEVNNAISNLQKVDKQTKASESSFKVWGTGIMTAVSIVAGVITNIAKQSINAWENQKQAVDVLNATLFATGATAWTSSKQLQEMASSLQKITNYGDETIIQMQSVLLGFKNIKGETFNDATKAILDMATVMKMDLSSAAQAVGKALDDPINGITSLQRQGFRFSESQKEVIQALIDTGDMAAAQKIILDELDTTYGGAAEAAVKTSVQVKNAWGDLKEGVGAFFEGFFDGEAGKKFEGFLSIMAEAFATFHDNVAFLKGIKSEEAFNVYFSGLSDMDERIEAASFWVAKYAQTIRELEAELEKDIPRADRYENQYFLAQAKENIELWKNELQMLQDIQATDQKIQQQKNDQIAAETAISELMHAIGLDYEKLSKDDPVIQLQKYQQQLEKIQKDKETLSSTTTGLDTADAIRQLDYNAEQIKARMQEIRNKLQDDGKKSWQSYFEKVTGVSASSFTTGKEAGQLYIDGLSKAFNDAESLSALLGKKFDAKAVIESQMAELEKSITNLLDIPAEKINEVYSTADNSIKAMIDEYRHLNEEKKKFEVTDALEELETKVQQLTMSERELYIQKLLNNEATDEQIQKANELFDLYDEALGKRRNDAKDDKEVFSSWQEALDATFFSLIEKLNLFEKNADESNKVIAKLGATLVNLAVDSTMQGLEALGEALGKGESAGEGLNDMLESMAQTILNQLPTLFLNAGLTLISQGQWPIGLGLIAAGLGTTFVGGFNQGVIEKAEANALGNVYGDGVFAFANGGTFTNQIVNSPTLFKFARGGKMGTGLMGEAGPEAILPLRRGADGTLGVEASGSGANVAVILEVNNYSSEKVETQETTDEFGQKKIMVMIGSMINQHIAGGKADKALSSRYGLKAQGF